MNSDKFIKYRKLVAEFKEQIEVWNGEYPDLYEEINGIKELEEKKLKTEKGRYLIENLIVFNKHLEEIADLGKIKYMIVADNPGKDEQLTKNCRYLIGTAGKVTRNYFERNKLVENFDSEVLVLNKTPIHTGKTILLKKIKNNHSLVVESQRYMADFIYKLHKLLGFELWIIGYSEMKKKGIFAEFLDAVKENYQFDSDLKDKISIFMHFSMGSFQRDYNKNAVLTRSLLQNLDYIGKHTHRKEYLGW